jgi:hypothetical protein
MWSRVHEIYSKFRAVSPTCRVSQVEYRIRWGKPATRDGAPKPEESWEAAVDVKARLGGRGGASKLGRYERKAAQDDVAAKKAERGWGGRKAAAAASGGDGSGGSGGSGSGGGGGGGGSGGGGGKTRTEAWCFTLGRLESEQQQLFRWPRRPPPPSSSSGGATFLGGGGLGGAATQAAVRALARKGGVVQREGFVYTDGVAPVAAPSLGQAWAAQVSAVSSLPALGLQARILHSVAKARPTL